jgi:hypothetical protein
MKTDGLSKILLNYKPRAHQSIGRYVFLTIQVHNKAHMDIWYTAMGLYKTQRLQSKFLHSVTKAPWHVSNFTIHNDLQIPFVTQEIHRLSTVYHQSILGHNNRLVVEISSPPTVRRRLKRQWPSDLPQPADDKN